MKNLKKNDVVKVRVKIYTDKGNLTKVIEDYGKSFLLCETEYYGVAIDVRRIRLEEGTVLVAHKRNGFGKTHTQYNWNRPIDNQWAIVDKFEIIERA